MGLPGSPKCKTEECDSKISFDSLMDVVLIPTREEYSRLSSELWWEKVDYSLFQQSAFSEIRLYATLYSLEFKKARSKLYQPNGDLKEEGENILEHSTCDESTTKIENTDSDGTSNSTPKNNSCNNNNIIIDIENEEEEDSHDWLNLCVRIPKQSFSFVPVKDRNQSKLLSQLNLGLILLSIPIGIYIVNSVL